MFTELIDSIIAMIKDNLIVSVAVGIVVLFIAYRSFKFLFKIIVLLALVAAVFYVIMNMASVGTEKKQGLHEKSLPENAVSHFLRL